MEQIGLQGLKISGVLHSTDASAGAEVPLYQQDTGAAAAIGTRDYLAVSGLTLVTAAGGDAFVFFDNDGLASALDIAEADATANTFTVAGDRADEFRAGRTFTVANSTGNDGGSPYTSTGATYDADADQTTISVSSVADGTDDGDITSIPLRQDKFTVLRGTWAANGGESKMWDQHLRRGPLGYTLYADAPAGAVDVTADGYRRESLVKTGPAGQTT